MEEGDSDVSVELDDYSSAGTKYKAMKESLKIDLDTVKKEIEADELLKTKEIETKKVCKGPGKNSELEKENIGSCENGETADEESETNKRPMQITRRGRKRNSDHAVTKTPEKQRNVSDSPIYISDSPVSNSPVNILITSEESNVDDNFIYISSSDESYHSLDVSLPEEDNYEISVKVWWKFDRFDKFNVRRFQKLACLFEHYSKLEGVTQNQILLTLNDNAIHPNDTPDSLKLTVAHIIEGGIMSAMDDKRLKAVLKQQESALSKDELELKVQRKGCKEPLIVRILKTQKMKIFMLKCAENLELPIEKLKFSFDGDTLNSNDTPIDLDLEGGECIDLHISE